MKCFSIIGRKHTNDLFVFIHKNVPRFIQKIPSSWDPQKHIFPLSMSGVRSFFKTRRNFSLFLRSFSWAIAQLFLYLFKLVGLVYVYYLVVKLQKQLVRYAWQDFSISLSFPLLNFTINNRGLGEKRGPNFFYDRKKHDWFEGNIFPLFEVKCPYSRTYLKFLIFPWHFEIICWKLSSKIIKIEDYPIIYAFLWKK